MSFALKWCLFWLLWIRHSCCHLLPLGLGMDLSCLGVLGAVPHQACWNGAFPSVPSLITISSVSVSQCAIPIHLHLLLLQVLAHRGISHLPDHRFWNISLFVPTLCSWALLQSQEIRNCGGKRKMSTAPPKLHECHVDTFSAQCVLRAWHWDHQMGSVERKAFSNSRCESKKNSIARTIQFIQGKFLFP